MESLQILFEDLSGLDFVLILKLLGGQKTCEYLSQFESCVHLARFSIMGHTIQAKFIHQKPAVHNYQLFSCSVFQQNGKFYISDLHNRLIAIHELNRFNDTRLVSEKDYVLKDLKMVSRKVSAKNSRLCYLMVCLVEITYHINGSLEICQQGDSFNYCDSFVLQFNQGVISSDHLAESRIEYLGWGTSIVEHTDEAIPVSGQITGDNGNDNFEDEIVVVSKGNTLDQVCLYGLWGYELWSYGAIINNIIII